MARKLFILSMFVLISISGLYAQEKKDSTDEKSNVENWLDWDNYDWFRWEFHGRPFMEVNYGLGKLNHNKLVSKFADIGLLELKLGYASRYSYFEKEIIEFKEKYAFVSRLRADLKSSSVNLGEMKSDMWKFGFANRKGYGYHFDQLSILPYHGEGYVWSRLDMLDYPAQFYLLLNPPMSLGDASDDTEILNRYHQDFRFGTFNEAGIRIEISSSFSLNAGYEAVVIFPRHLFWKHLGSMIIENAAQGLLNNFIDEVGDSSPYVLPVINFLLKNGLSYAFFTFKKDRMNWPFATETPLTGEIFKFGVTFTF